jgi:CBS domain-containing protein
MKVEQIMSRNVRTCSSEDSLNTAARIMWENDCGCVPVVDAGNHVMGMLTDRDISMAAYIQGRRLNDMSVSSAMSRDVFTCQPDDNVTAAGEVLRMHRIRRLPVVDKSGVLVGLLSLNDIACEAQHERRQKGKRLITMDEVGMTFGAVCQHRPEDLVAPV